MNKVRREMDDPHREVPFYSTLEDLEKRKGKFAKHRFNYLQALVTEFQDTTKQESKEEVLAHLANFAYDPINYEWFRQLHVIDLFLDSLSEPEPLREYAIGGLCNLCLDPKNAALIVENQGIGEIIKCLSSPHEETVLSAITTLYYLLAYCKKDIATKSVVECMVKYAQSKNPRLKNIATIFVQDLALFDDKSTAHHKK